MRAFIVVLALLATPLAIGVSQTGLPGHSDCDNGLGDDNRSDSGTVHAHQGLCVPQPPPPTCGQLPAATGNAVVQGQVFQDVSFLGLPNWCVDLSGPVSGSILTPASGNYTFSGLPPGTYTVCEEIQSGWSQTYPPSPQNGAVCASGFGWRFTLADGDVTQMIDFGNVTP